jgi:hypothetical protein
MTAVYTASGPVHRLFATGERHDPRRRFRVVQFPKTAEERRALRKAKDDLEKQRLINVFIDEQGGSDQALFHTRDGVAYADLIVAGHRETWPVRSRQFRHHYLRYLQRQFDRLVADETQPLLALAMKASMGKTAVNHAIDDFERRAICSTVTRDVHVRVAGHNGEIFIDLGNDAWEAVCVTSAGWRVVIAPPVRFRRTDGMLPLPIPERGGKVETLRLFLNVTASDFTLVVAYLLSALYPKGPYPILILYGVQGAAKTAFLRKLRKLVDAHVVGTSALPASSRDLFISAHNSHAQAYENVSKLSDAMSDALCRLATGGGHRTRKLFKDSDEVHFYGGRPIMFEGIANVVSKPDLGDYFIRRASHAERPPLQVSQQRRLSSHCRHQSRNTPRRLHHPRKSRPSRRSRLPSPRQHESRQPKMWSGKNCLSCRKSPSWKSQENGDQTKCGRGSRA